MYPRAALVVGMALAVAGTAGAAEPPAQGRRIEYALAVHGGAGTDPGKLTAEQRAAYHTSMEAALRVGRKILADGGTALDAVEQTVRALEDDPLFNAGRGAVFNAAGGHELDASIMDGRTKACGGVAGVRTVKNPVSLARLVMTETRHVLMAGDGAEQFADEMRSRPQVERVPNAYFSTPGRRAEWERAVERQRRQQEQPGQQQQQQADPPASDKGTVGCVALDRHGNLAAATSTGGLTNKRFGRVGDTPIAGAGTYADNATCAVSCTGTGEHFIRHAVAFQVTALMRLGGRSLDESVRELIFRTLDRDVGGLIAVGRDGSIAMHTNTAGMPRGAADSTGRWEVSIGAK